MERQRGGWGGGGWGACGRLEADRWEAKEGSSPPSWLEMGGWLSHRHGQKALSAGGFGEKVGVRPCGSSAMEHARLKPSSFFFWLCFFFFLQSNKANASTLKKHHQRRSRGWIRVWKTWLGYATLLAVSYSPNLRVSAACASLPGGGSGC